MEYQKSEKVVFSSLIQICYEPNLTPIAQNLWEKQQRNGFRQNSKWWKIYLVAWTWLIWTHRNQEGKKCLRHLEFKNYVPKHKVHHYSATIRPISIIFQQWVRFPTYLPHLGIVALMVSEIQILLGQKKKKRNPNRYNIFPAASLE